MHNFILTNFNYSIIQTDGTGSPIIAICNLNLEEYIERIDRIGEISTVEQKKTKLLDDKTIKNINAEIISALNGERLW